MMEMLFGRALSESRGEILVEPDGPQ